MKTFLLHVGVSPHNTDILPMANPCFNDRSFVFVPWCTGTDTDFNADAPLQTEYQNLDHPSGLRELLSLHPRYGKNTIHFKTQNNPEFVNFTFGEWFKAKRTARLFPLMSVGDIVYFAASFVCVDMPKLEVFVRSSENYQSAISKCFSRVDYGQDGFIGVFAHFVLEEILGDEEYFGRGYNNSGRLEQSRWDSERDNVLVRGDPIKSEYWSKVVPIGKGNSPSEAFSSIYDRAQRMVKWSGMFDEESARSMQSFFTEGRK